MQTKLTLCVQAVSISAHAHMLMYKYDNDSIWNEIQLDSGHVLRYACGSYTLVEWVVIFSDWME